MKLVRVNAFIIGISWKLIGLMLVINIGALGSLHILAQERSRETIDEKYKWNLADIYPSVEEWQKDKATFPERFQKAASFRGSLKTSGKHLFEALEYIHNVIKDFDKLWVYASMLSDQDTRESEPMAMKEELNQRWTTFTSSLSYLEPEILSIPEEKLNQFFEEEPKLEVYCQYIDNIQRIKAHILSEAEEKIIAQTGLMSGIAQGVHNVFGNADMPYPVVTFSDGTEVVLDVPTYTKYRYSSNSEDRIKVFSAFFGALGRYRRTYGALLSGKIKENLFYKGVRKYDSVLEMSLYRNNIPATVYTNLIKNVHQSLPLLHRYLRIRKRMLGVDELHYYDFYPDLVQNIEIKFPYEEAQEILKKALSVLGDEYISKLEEAFNNRWIDVYPSRGKASGAYSNCAYDTHPYIKLNYNDRFADMSMLAHELGHALHSYYSNKSQPYVNSNYSSFVAEIAATTNESLLADYVIKTMDDPEKKLSLLGNWVEAFRQTVFRQTLFAEFELLVNHMAEKGETLSGDRFSEIYLELLRKYYGHEEGASVIDDIFGHEWAYISHFFLGFYNYQYSTSYAAALALAEKILTGGEDMVKRYIDFLSSGCSDYSIPMLKKLGIDMTANEPFELAMNKMSKAMDEMEKILDSQKR